MSETKLPIIEYNLLMNVPANCLNRDDTGMPKTFVFDGVLRNAISSQCMKYAWRHSYAFTEKFGPIAKRTRQLPTELYFLLQGKGYTDEQIRTVCEALLTTEKSDKNNAKDSEKSEEDGDAKKPAKKAKAKDEDAKPLAMNKMSFYSDGEIEALAEALDIMWQKEGEAGFKNTKGFGSRLAGYLKKYTAPVRMTVDQALCGRMVTDDLLDDIDGAMQVSRAMSTGEAKIDADYFTAVDDVLLHQKGAAVVGHLNSTDYGSACFYVHVIIDLDQFARNMGMTADSPKDLKDLVSHLAANMLEIISFTMPSGKQNSFEAHVFPEAVYVAVKSSKRSENLCNAFRNSSHLDTAEASVQAMASEVERSVRVFDVVPDHAVWLQTRDEYAVPHADCIDVCQSINEMKSKLNEWCAEAVD